MSEKRESSSLEVVVPSQPGQPSNSFTDIIEDRSTASLSLSGSDRHNSALPLTGGSKIKRVYARPPHYLPLSLIVMVLNPVLGCPAVICSFLSQKHTRNGNASEASRYSKVALWLSIIALASFLVILMFVIFYVFVITPNIIRSIDWFANTTKDDTAHSADGLTTAASLATTSTVPNSRVTG